MRVNLLLAIFVLALCVYPTTSISRWFSAAFNDLKFTLYRYGHCYTGLQPLNGYNLNETEFLIHQIKVFLDEGNYDNEQLANVTALMDSICEPSNDTSYPISVHVDVYKFSNNNTAGKENRCNAIDDIMGSMYYVFKRSAMNHSEPLDFSQIQFYPNETNRSTSYGLTDLINVSWIKSETVLEHVCGITNSTKEYIQMKSSNATAQARSETTGRFSTFVVDYINRLLDPILGLQKRLYWESTNRFGQFQSRLSSGVQRTRQMVFGSVRNLTTTSQDQNRQPAAPVYATQVANVTTTVSPLPAVTSVSSASTTPAPTNSKGTTVTSSLSSINGSNRLVVT